MSQKNTLSAAALRAAERVTEKQAYVGLMWVRDARLVELAAIIDAEIAPLVEALRAALNEMEQSGFFYLKPVEEQARAALRRAEGGGE
jgi:hypothetical protein